MTSERSPNRERLVRTARRLEPLLGEMVFVGGQMAEHLVTDPAAVSVRSTVDVDAVVRVTTRQAWDELQGELRALGFQPDMSRHAPICRMQARGGLILDVMPLDEAILGFTNRWYAHAIESAWDLELEPGLRIRAIAGPAFLATKWEAYASRGRGDIIMSPDIEDIVTVVAGRPSIAGEVEAAPHQVTSFIGAHARALLDDLHAEELVDSAIRDARLVHGLRDRVLARFQALARAG